MFPRGGRATLGTPPADNMFAPPADTIELSMRRLKGKTFTIYTPADLNKAIQEIAAPAK